MGSGPKLNPIHLLHLLPFHFRLFERVEYPLSITLSCASTAIGAKVVFNWLVLCRSQGDPEVTVKEGARQMLKNNGRSLTNGPNVTIPCLQHDTFVRQRRLSGRGQGAVGVR